MIKTRYILASGAGIAVMTFSALGIASAATMNDKTSTTGNVGTSSIPRSTYRTDRQNAVAKVLNTTTDKVEAAHKDKTFKALLTNAGLTEETFHEKVKAELTSELKAQGYSQDQITIALQHKELRHLRHHKKSS